MKIFIKIKLLAIVLFLGLNSNLLAAEPVAEKVPVEILEELKVIYPASQKGTGNEGWARLNFIIDKNGRPKDILIEDSYGGKPFEDAAMQAIMNGRYKPGSFKGQVVEQSIGDFFISIASDETKLAVDQAFADSYQNIVNLIQENKTEEAENLTNTLVNKGNLSLEEIVRIEVLRSQFAIKKGDILKQVKHLRNARMANGVFLPQNILIDVIRMHSAVALRNSLFMEAFDSYILLERIAPENELVTKLALLQAPIKKAIQDGRPIRVRGALDERGQWIYRPFRTNFSFTYAAEGIKTFEPRCDHSNQKFAVEIGKEWRIPASWGYCTAVIYGEPGAEFELMEYADPEDEE